MDIIIKRLLKLLFDGHSDNEIRGFIKYYGGKLWTEYKQYQMDQRVVIENKLKNLQLSLPNASVNKEYNASISVNDADLTDISLELPSDDLGLQVEKGTDGRTFQISGIPCLDGNFKLKLSCRSQSKHLEKPVVRELQLRINPDPRTMWKDLPVDPKIEDPKADTDHKLLRVEADSRVVAAASRRGRSHAHAGLPRDDDFAVVHDESGWYVLAVADGAGSAAYSRTGSKIACEKAVAFCLEQLAQVQQFETDIHEYQADQKSAAVQKKLHEDLYKILITAAKKSCQAVWYEAEGKNRQLRDYATTLLLTLCRKFDFGWFIASFWVGDGAICVYQKQEDKPVIKLLGNPDEGEYNGQTRFLMPNIFEASVYERIKCTFVPDSEFTALFMMTDGVSDPKFGSDVSLHDPSKWEDLWTDLREDKENRVDFSHDNEKTDEQLLEWLTFFSVGHHDDRTIVVLY